jgi:hypothetical protein
MLMSTLIWTLTRANLCHAKSVELNSRSLDSTQFELDIVEEESYDEDEDEDEY